MVFIQFLYIFQRQDTKLFYLLLRNNYIHTVTYVFEVNKTFKQQFSLDLDSLLTYFKALHFIEDDLFLQLLKEFFSYDIVS
jgi:hypothetical protein